MKRFLVFFLLVGCSPSSELENHVTKEECFRDGGSQFILGHVYGSIGDGFCVYNRPGK